MHENLQDYDNALACCREHFELIRDLWGPADERTLAIKQHLGSLYRSANQLELAETTLTEVLVTMKQRPSGSERADTVPVRMALSSLRRDLGQWSQADTLLREALAIAGREPDNPQLRTIENNLAGLLFVRGKYREALPIFQKLLAEEIKMQGPESQETDVAKFNVAAQHFGLQQYEEAETTLRELIACQKKRKPLDRMAVFDAQIVLAKVYSKQDRLPQSEELLRTIVSGQSPGNATESAMLAKAWGNLASCLLRQEKYAEAREAAESAIAMRPRIVPPDFADFQLRALLGAARAGLGEHTAAETLLLESLDGMLKLRTKTPHAHLDSIVAAAAALGRLYSETGKAEDAARWKGKAEAWEQEFGAATM